MLHSDPDKNARAQERLRTEPVAWLTTVRHDGQPQSSPVWFIWDGKTILLYSQPKSQKVPNIRANPRVSFHFNDHDGGDVVTLEGTAQIREDQPPAHEVSEYLEKYRPLIRDLGTEPEPFAQLYSAAIRITPTRARVG